MICPKTLGIRHCLGRFGCLRRVIGLDVLLDHVVEDSINNLNCPGIIIVGRELLLVGRGVPFRPSPASMIVPVASMDASDIRPLKTTARYTLDAEPVPHTPEQLGPLQATPMISISTRAPCD